MKILRAGCGGGEEEYRREVGPAATKGKSVRRRVGAQQEKGDRCKSDITDETSEGARCVLF